ncbi:hypothetical protein T484DRAFT_1750760 [Baffinella frigidus]|nr:hypothetical protein T484DRAFT_1750760 [Cryptophyta sp. CCMP2293]
MRAFLPLVLTLALLATLAVPTDAKKLKKKAKSGPPAPLAASKLARSRPSTRSFAACGSAFAPGVPHTALLRVPGRVSRGKRPGAGGRFRVVSTPGSLRRRAAGEARERGKPREGGFKLCVLSGLLPRWVWRICTRGRRHFTPPGANQGLARRSKHFNSGGG